MEVLRHEDVAVHAEPKLSAGFFEEFEKDSFDTVVFKKRAPPVATASDEVRAVGIVTALEECRHELRLGGFVP